MPRRDGREFRPSNYFPRISNESSRKLENTSQDSSKKSLEYTEIISQEMDEVSREIAEREAELKRRKYLKENPPPLYD
jgi:hypothetical protein